MEAEWTLRKKGVKVVKGKKKEMFGDKVKKR